MIKFSVATVDDLSYPSGTPRSIGGWTEDYGQALDTLHAIARSLEVPLDTNTQSSFTERYEGEAVAHYWIEARRGE